MATYNPFDLVVVPFPFTDRNSSKRRPALVLSNNAFWKDSGNVILAMITSAKRSSWRSDVSLKEWRNAGLPHASVVRPKIFTLDARFVLRKLGALAPPDRQQVARSLSSVFGHALKQ